MRVNPLATALASFFLALCACQAGAGGGGGDPSDPGGGGDPGATVGPPGRGPAPQPTGSGVALYVSKGGSDANPCSQAAPCLTIQRAADRATAPGSVVLVADGDYAGFCSVHPGVTFFGNGDSVRITSALQGADCNQRGRVGINVEGTDGVVVAGFTVSGMPYWGIRAVVCRGAVIRHDRVQGNGLSGHYSGILTGFALEAQVLYNETSGNTEHGIYVSNSDAPHDRPVIRGNDTHDNTYNGIQINGDCFTESDAGSDGKVEEAVVDANHVHQNGAKGLSMISAPGVYISNNVIEDNGPAAGGVHLVNEPGCPASDSTIGAVVVNNTIVETSMAAVRVNDDATGAIVFNNILVSPRGGVVVDAGDPAPAVSATNLQAGSTAGVFASGYQLSPTSAARDAGEPSYHGKGAPSRDLAGTARPKGAGYDLGAYESF